MSAKTLTRIGFILSRLVCLLLGILILLTVAPHRNPWLMVNVASEWHNKETTIQVQVALFHWEVQFSLTTLIFVFCLILACLISLSRDARNALMEFVQRRRWFLVSMISCLCLFLMQIAVAFLTLIVGLLLIRLFS